MSNLVITLIMLALSGVSLRVLGFDFICGVITFIMDVIGGMFNCLMSVAYHIYKFLIGIAE